MASKIKVTVRKAEAPKLSVLANGSRAIAESAVAASAREKMSAGARKQHLRKALPPASPRRFRSRAETNVARKIREAKEARGNQNSRDEARLSSKKGNARNQEDAEISQEERARDENHAVASSIGHLSSKLQCQNSVKPTPVPTGLSAAERAAVSEVWVDQMLSRGQTRDISSSSRPNTRAKLEPALGNSQDFSEHVSKGADESGPTLASSINSRARQYLHESGLDRGSLDALGLRKEEIDRMYRAMYVYSIGFHQCVTDIVKESAVARPELVGRIWRTYSRLLELSERDNSDDGVAALERSHLDEMGRLKAQLAQAEASWAAQLVASRAEVKDSHEQLARRKQEVTELERRLSESAEELALARLTTEQEISRHADTAKELDASRARLAQLSTQLKEANLERSKLDASLVEAREGIAAAEKRANDANMQRQRACQRAEDARSDADKLQASLVATTAHVRDLKDQLQAKGDEIETLLAKVEELNAEVLARQSSETTRVKQLRELRFERSRLQRLLAEENKKSQDIRTELETEIVEHARAHRELTRVTEEYSHVEKQFQTVSKEHASLQERNNAVGSKLGATQALNKEYKEEMDRANARVASIGAELDVMSSKFEAETKQRLVVEEALRKRTMELATSVDALAKAKRTLSDRADAAQDARKRIVALESKMTVERASAQERIRRAADEAASLRSQVSELQAEARELRSESGSQLEAAKESAEARIQVARDEMAQLRRSLEACRQKELLLSTEVGAIAQNLSVNFACAADATAVREAVDACLAREVDFRERLAASEEKLASLTEALRDAEKSVDAKSVLANEVERLERSEQDLQNLVSSTREDLQSVQAFAREISQERDEAQKNLSAAEQHIGSLKSRLAEAQAMIKELEKDRESVAKHSDELLESMTAEIEHVSVLKSANVALEAELQRLVSMRPNDAKLRTADASTQVDSDAFSSSAATSEGVEAGAE